MSRRNRNRIESESESDDDDESTNTPRRSFRIRNRSMVADDDSDIMDSSPQSSNRSNNRNANHNRNNAQESDIDFDEDKNEFDDDTSDDNGDDDHKDENNEPLDIGYPKYSLILPTAISKLGTRYQHMDKETEENVLRHLIDTAQDLAEYNHEQHDYDEESQKLQSVMHRILNASKDFKIETLMLHRVTNDIREGETLDNKEDDNPTQTGDWMGYLETKRNAVRTEIESGRALDGESARIKNKINANKRSYEEQFKDAIQLDDIEDPDIDSNHNNRNNNASDDDDDDDLHIVVDKSAKSTGSIKCPLSLKVFETPWISTVCGHTFEKEAILQYIKSRNDSGELVSCPLPGCEKVLNADAFRRDTKMERLVKAQSKQDEEQESEEDEDEEGMDFTLADT